VNENVLGPAYDIAFVTAMFTKLGDGKSVEGRHEEWREGGVKWLRRLDGFGC